MKQVLSHFTDSKFHVALHCARLVVSDSFVTPWIVTCQAPLSMGFFRQEYWSGLPFPPLGDLPNPEIELADPILAGGFYITEPPGKPLEDSC